MSNIAGKAYAINVVTPVKYRGFINRVIFWAIRAPVIGRFLKGRINGLLTLSLIHYARWVVVGPKDFPHFEGEQEPEDLRYAYEFFFSNFNGGWNQYIDSFSMTINAGLDLFWWFNVGYPNSVPIEPFHRYINANQIQTDYYFNAYPLASSNDVKAGAAVRAELLALDAQKHTDPATFGVAYAAMLTRLQHAVSPMDETPIVSLAYLATQKQAS